MTKLSHTRASLYLECPRKFKYGYIDNLTPIYTSSALVFGKAIDIGLESMFKDSMSYKEDFLAYWNAAEISMINFTKGDLDLEVLKEDQIASLSNQLSIDDIDAFIKEKEKSLLYLKKEDKEKINVLGHLCLKEKGLLFLDYVFNTIKPKIKNVISLQEEVSIKADNGDEIVGFIDMVAEVEGYDKPVILDFKTSSKRYNERSGIDSQQLNLYHFSAGEKYKTNLVGFIVISKDIKQSVEKSCPECKEIYTSPLQKNCKTKKCKGELVSTKIPKLEHQIVINEIDVNKQNMFIENMSEVSHAIKCEVFPRNFSACYNYNQRCQYYEYCFNNESKYLKQKEESNG